MNEQHPMVRMGKVAIVLVVVGLAAFLAGERFGRPVHSQDTPPDGPVDPCSLITEQEAEAALGYPVIVTPTTKACSFTVDEPGEFISLSVALGPQELAAGEDGESTFAAAMQAYAEAANASLRHAVAGDEAWATLSDPASQVIARRGDQFVTVILINVHSPEAQRVITMQDLAQKALSRLPS